MQQIINFIIKNSTKLLFLLLLGISLILTIQSHSFHRSRFVNSANSLTGGVYSRVSAFREYLNLKSENERLAAENAALKTLLYNQADTLQSTLQIPSNLKGQYRVTQAKVIKNSYNVHENILTINVGTKQGVRPFMGVVNSKGIIGITDIAADNHATVISVLNIKSKVNAKIKKSNHFGTLTWNGKNAGIVQLIDIPRLASVRRGDTIVTGAQSVFPENINIGTIDKVYEDSQTNLFTLDIKLFNDMTSVGHIYVIENKDREEILELQKQAENEQ
ncbi:MAG: rod shape-determining protein MreC [Flavobacteriaceae bacterium]|jgi:rod shape-determining protein MreC|nr:rod shape-determining protein MreC [Flavobacteriaceae bacterium]